MSKPERKRKRNRPGRPETRVLKINLAVEEAVRRMFAYGLPRRKRTGTVSQSGEPVQVRNQDPAPTAGTQRPGPR